jgi:transporter family-2 protein
MMPFQAATSAAMGKRTTFPSFAALISFLVGLIPVFIYFLIETKGGRTIHSQNVSGIPWWIWTGGLVGAFYVIIISIFTQKLGATVLLGIIVICQLVGATIFDHFGWFELPVRHVQIWRIIGLCFVATGVLIITISEARKSR